MINIRTLSNGIRVVTDAIPFYSSVSLGVWVKVGSASETKANNGISHVIEHMLFKGTTTRTAKDLADQMTAIGGYLDAYTSKEFTCYYTRTLAEHLDESLEIISDMLINSTIDETELKKELGVILEEIDMYEDDPDELVHELLQKDIWRGHPIGYIISGEKQTVKNFTRADICSFMAEHYVAENIVISLAGQIDEERIIADLEKYFGQIAPGAAKHSPDLPQYHRSFVLKHKDVEQTYLNLAYDSIAFDDERKYALTLFNNILGGNMNSLLFQEVRENRGLAYSVYSYGSAFVSSGLLQINASMNPAQVSDVLSAVNDVLTDVKNRSITGRELAIAKEQLKTELLIGNESTKGRMESNGKVLMYKNTIATLDEVLERIKRVSLEDIYEFIDTFIDMSGVSMSLVGDTTLIKVKEIKELMKF